MTVQEVFKQLDSSARECLMCAFQAGMSKHIELANGQFIGVNVQYIQYLVPTETEGVWSIGHMKGKTCHS